MATWLIISGSPYGAGTCAHVAKRIEALLHDLDAEADVQLFSVASLDVHGCIGCDECKDNFICIYHDDQLRLMSVLDAADAALVISPIYFAGVPSQFKALLDRFQPYFWKRQAYRKTHDTLPEKRPLYLALVGEGGDPYGAEPAIPSVTSPFALANFKLARVHTFIHEDEERIYAKLAHQIHQAHKELVS